MTTCLRCHWDYQSINLLSQSKIQQYLRTGYLRKVYLSKVYMWISLTNTCLLIITFCDFVNLKWAFNFTSSSSASSFYQSKVAMKWTLKESGISLNRLGSFLLTFLIICSISKSSLTSILFNLDSNWWKISF